MKSGAIDADWRGNDLRALHCVSIHRVSGFAGDGIPKENVIITSLLVILLRKVCADAVPVLLQLSSGTLSADSA